MDSVESELLKNLENLFGFQYKGKKFQDLNTQDFLDVYKIFFRIYDTAWLLSDGKPKSAILKQITSFLQRMELGHLVIKGEDLLDCKKNCRILGAIVSKLESRHNGTQNIQAAVRKIRLLKPKTAAERNFQKQTSSASSGEEEPVKLELVIPRKGKELPRTPTTKPGSDSGADRGEFLKPELVTSPLAAHLNLLPKPTKIVSTQKGFRPILPTKEIPRTPLGVATTGPAVDSCFTGHNLTADFSSARLTSSNTSTPYDHRTSRSKTLSGEGDATFVVCTKRGVMENPENDNKELSETEEDVFEEDNAMAGTYVKETKPKENPASGNKNSWVIELEMSKSDSDEVPPTEMLPGPDSTFALPKKNVGKATKTNKGKDSAADKDDEETTTVKKAPEVKPENVETNGVAAKGKKGRGKKAGKKDAGEENHIEAVLVAKVVEPETPVLEIEHEVSAPVAESKGKKGRGKKAAAKKDAIEEAIVSAEPEIPEDEKETKKGRSKRPSKKEANEEKHEEVVENNHPVEVEAPIAEIKEKKGRGKKAQPPAKAEEIDSLHEDIPEPVAEEKAVEVTAGPKPKTGPKSKVGPKSKMETKPAEEEDKNPSVAEKKGRGKKAHPSADSASQVASEVDTPEAQAVEATENSAAPEVKKGRGKKAGSSPQAVPEVDTPEAQAPQAVEATENSAAPEVKKGRGKKANQLTGSSPQAVPEVDTPEDQAPLAVEATENSAAPEVKKGRGKAKAKLEEVQEHKESENLVATQTDTKEKRGRGRQTSSKDGTEKPAKTSEEPLSDDEIESSLPAVPVVETKEKKGRGRQAKAPVEVPVEETIEAQEAAPAKRGRGKKAVVPAVSKVDSEEEAVEEVKETKAKGKKGVAVSKKQIEEEEEKSAVPEEASAPAEEVMETIESPETVPVKKGRGKKATASAAPVKVVEELEEEAEAVEEVKETKGKGKKVPAAKKQVEEKAAIPETTEKAQKTNKRGKAASATPEESDVSPPKKAKERSLESEGVRKSSRNQGEPVKKYDESSDNVDQPASKKRGGKKKSADSVDAIAEETEENKKKPTKKKATSESPEPKPEPQKVGKVAAAKRGTKRGQTEDPSVPVEEKKQGSKKGDKSPELPLRVVNGLEEETEANPPKRNKASDKAETAAEEPEKKTVRGRKKKEDPQLVETENKSPDDGKKKAKRVGKEEATVEVEKKKPVGRKKAAAAQEKEPETVTSPVLTKQRGKRAVVQDADSDVFVAVISGQQSTDPSPAGPPVTKGRRLKLVLEKLPAASAQADSDEEISVPAVATKRNYTRRNK